jgi:hypothetical protein
MINLIPLNDNYTICQLSDYKDIPESIFSAGFFSVTKTDDEVSLITNCTIRLENIRSVSNWKGFKVEGILDFSMTGIINELTLPLKENNIPVFVTSTFNTDYLFVKEEVFEKAVDAFKKAKNINIMD